MSNKFENGLPYSRTVLCGFLILCHLAWCELSLASAYVRCLARFLPTQLKNRWMTSLLRSWPLQQKLSPIMSSAHVLLDVSRSITLLNSNLWQVAARNFVITWFVHISSNTQQQCTQIIHGDIAFQLPTVLFSTGFYIFDNPNELSQNELFSTA